MGIYQVNGTTAATAATDQHALAEIWNPSATRWIEILEFQCFAFAAPGAGAGFIIRRATAKGTAGSTVTPTAEYHTLRQAAPDSGFTLELAAFSVQPTLATGDLSPTGVFAAVAASGFVFPLPYGISVPPGTGVCIVNRAAIAIPTCEVGFTVREV